MALKLVESRAAKEEEKRKYQEIVNDQNWLAQHSVEIREKYKGKYIVIVRQKLFVGDTREEAICKAKEKYPDQHPLIRHTPYKRRIWIL